jgi:hypothetical protein
MLQEQRQPRPRHRLIGHQIAQIVHDRAPFDSERTLNHITPVKAKLLLT